MIKHNCPKCNAEFVADSKFCQKCGCNLELEFIENPICPKCKKSFSVGSKFCDVDGTKLISIDKLIPRCIKCGREYSADTKYCSIDGGLVTSEAFKYDFVQNTSFDIGNYPKASLGNRFLASLLDSLIILGLSIPAGIFYMLGIVKLVSYYEDAAPYFVLAIIFYFIPLVYSFIKDGLGKGQSWGKKAVGLMVIHLPDNTPCSKGKSSLRCLIGIVLAIIPFIGWLIEPIMVLVEEKGRRLADKVANTQVIDVNMYNN